MYYNTNMIKNDKNNPVKILYFDTETVTLESPAESCTFFQLGGIIEIDGVEVERFNFFMNPDNTCEYNPDSLAFNKITKDDLEKYPSHEEVFPKVLAILDKYVNKFDRNDKLHVIGFNNLKFDNDKLWNWFALMDKILGEKYNTYGSRMWTSPSIDCYPIIGLVFIKYRSLFPNFKLETVARKLAEMKLIDEKFNDDEGWHDALFDIEATRAIFHFALKAFKFDLFNEFSENKS